MQSYIYFKLSASLEREINNLNIVKKFQLKAIEHNLNHSKKRNQIKEAFKILVKNEMCNRIFERMYFKTILNDYKKYFVNVNNYHNVDR